MDISHRVARHIDSRARRMLAETYERSTTLHRLAVEMHKEYPDIDMEFLLWFGDAPEDTLDTHETMATYPQEAKDLMPRRIDSV